MKIDGTANTHTHSHTTQIEQTKRTFLNQLINL